MPALPAQMTAIAIRAPGGADMLVPEQRPLPRPGKREVLVKVVVAGVNRPDVKDAAPRSISAPRWRN